MAHYSVLHLVAQSVATKAEHWAVMKADCSAASRADLTAVLMAAWTAHSRAALKAAWTVGPTVDPTVH